jgi:Tfp pilus assembly protein PilF
MTRLMTLTLTLVLAQVGTAAAQGPPERDRGRARQQVDFGVAMAVKGLWQEAIFRFEHARQLDPEYAEAYNNLAVAFESVGRLDEARAMYEQALALDPTRPYIQENYDRFLDVHNRPGPPRNAVPAVAPAAPPASGRSAPGGGPPR